MASHKPSCYGTFYYQASLETPRECVLPVKRSRYLNPPNVDLDSILSSMEKIRLPWRQLPLLSLPRFLSGFRTRDWLRLLHKHGFRVDPPFWPRVLLATVGAGVTSVLARFEELFARGQVDKELWERPVFILGLPRSGTSHLFELLSESPSLCFPTRFDAFNPHTFLLLRQVGLFAVLTKLPKFKRAMDNLRVGWGSPEEDIVALSILASLGERILQVFARDSAIEAIRGTNKPEKQREDLELIHALRGFSRKLALLHERRLLFKSPGHIGRVREILEVFPKAKFVTIFRNPQHQLASIHAMRHSGNPLWCALQWPHVRQSSQIVQLQGSRLRDYFAVRNLIPAGNLIEITFEKLVSDRVRTVHEICRDLALTPPTASSDLEANARDARPPRSVSASWIPLIRQHFSPLYDSGIYQCP